MARAMVLLLALVFVVAPGAHAMEDKVVEWADQSTNLAWLATPPLAALTPAIMSDQVPGFGRCVAGVLRLAKQLEQAHDSGEAKDLDETKLKAMAAKASSEGQSTCDDSCKLEMYKDAIQQRLDLWETVGKIIEPTAAVPPGTAISHSVEFFKFGLREWLDKKPKELAAFKSNCECEAGITNAYCHWRAVKTAGWPGALFDMDRKLQAVLVGIEQDQRVSRKHPDKLRNGKHNFLLQWKMGAREKFVRAAISAGRKRRAAGVVSQLSSFISSPKGQALKSALLLAKAVAVTGAVGVYATCDILHTGQDFAKAMSDLADASGGALCKSLQAKLDKSSADATEAAPRQIQRFRAAAEGVLRP